MKINPQQQPSDATKNKDIKYPGDDKSTAPVNLLRWDVQEDIFG